MIARRSVFFVADLVDRAALPIDVERPGAHVVPTEEHSRVAGVRWPSSGYPSHRRILVESGAADCRELTEMRSSGASMFVSNASCAGSLLPSRSVALIEHDQAGEMEIRQLCERDQRPVVDVPGNRAEDRSHRRDFTGLDRATTDRAC